LPNWKRCGVILSIVISRVPSAWGAHPLVTEDTATQGKGNVEWENGFGSTHLGPAYALDYQPQISYGVLAGLDLILQPAWLLERETGAATIRGLGDTNVDAKWRFFGRAPWSMAVRAGLAVSTNEHHLGLPPGTTSEHALLVFTYDEAPLTVHFNGGFTRNPDVPGSSRNLGHFSAAVLWTFSESLILSGEVAADSNPGSRGPWGETALTGIIYTVRPGLDIDLGFQVGRTAQMSSREWLGGVTYRFAL
jgi:hypothetical protein